MAVSKVDIDPFAAPACICSNLSEGDIVRCLLPTDPHKDGNEIPVYRYVAVLGVRINKDTHYPSDLYIARGAFLTKSYDPHTDVSLNPNQYSLTNQRDRNFILKTNRVDMVPVSVDFFENGLIEKVGEIYPKALKQVKEALCQTQADEAKRQATLFHEPIVDSWVVPSLLSDTFQRAGGERDVLKWSFPKATDYEKIREKLYISDPTDENEGTGSSALEAPSNSEMDLSFLPPPRKTKAERKEARRKKSSAEYRRNMQPW